MSIGLLAKPLLGECKVNLWPYQDEAVHAVRSAFARGDRSTLLVLPTGCGKTITFGMITRMCIEKGGRVLILAHREELIGQAADKLDLLGVEATIEQAGQYARAIWEPDCVIGTVQTMRGKRLASWAPDYFKMIITDEAHHATADSYTAIMRHFSGVRHLGVTATADRADDDELSDGLIHSFQDYELSNTFESVAYEYSLWDAMTAPYPGPYLCRLTFVRRDLEIDLRGLKRTKNDFNSADLAERIAPMVDIIANAAREEIGHLKTIMFAPDVSTAMTFAKAFKEDLGINADFVHGEDEDRKRKVAEFRNGAIQLIVNCGILTEGFDCPDVEAIVLKPTESRPLYAQMVGRGTRIAPGKSNCKIIDFSYLTDKHKLVRPVDLFCRSHKDTESLDIAMDLLMKDKTLALHDAIAKGSRIKQERALVRVKVRQREVKHRRIAYDPLAVCDTMGMPWRGQKNADATANKATEGQVKYLANLGVEGAEGISRARAGTLINFLKDRREKNLATMKQVSWMIAKGCDPAEARAMSFDAAKAYLDGVFNQRRDPVTA